MSIVNKPYKSRINANGEENGRVPFEDPTMLHNTSGEVLYADILSLHSRGLQRAKEYYEKWHRTGDVAQASRPTSQVNLKMVKIDNKQLEKEYEMCVCLDETKINKDRQLYTSSRVLAELNLLLEELDDKELERPDLPRNWNNVSKKVLVAALVTARKTLRLNDPINWETATKEVFKSRYEGQCTDPSEIVRDELKHSFYTFKDTRFKSSEIAMQNFRFILNNREGDANVSRVALEYTRDDEWVGLMTDLIALGDPL